MGISEPLLSAAGVAAAVAAMLVDGPNAALVVVLVIPAGLAPTVAVTSGGPALVVLAAAALAGLILGLAARRAARRLPWVAGLDPLIPAFAPPRGLFGPRSARAAASRSARSPRFRACFFPSPTSGVAARYGSSSHAASRTWLSAW